MWEVTARHQICLCHLVARSRAAIYRCALRHTLLSSLLHGSYTMSTVPSTPTSNSKFTSVFNAALEKYNRKTKQDLASHSLLSTFQSCDSPEAILTVLREQTPEFDQSQSSDDRLTKWVTPTVNVLYSFSATLGGVVGLVSISVFSYNIVQPNNFPGIPTR